MSNIIEIKGSLYKKCEEASKNYWCNKKSGFFGRGIANTKADPTKVTRVGLLGEAAVALALKLDIPDFSYRHGGDKADFILKSGKTIDVKTAISNYGSVLIRCESAKGRNVFKPKDYYVGCYLSRENKEKCKALINVVGWIDLKEMLANCGTPVPARVGYHKNYEIPFDRLNEINTFPKL